MKLAFVTCADLARYFPSSKDPLITHDDQVLADYLRQQGHEVEALVWGEPASQIASKNYDWLIVRSPWDYSESPAKRQKFQQWLEGLRELKCAIANPIDLMLWNLDKHYLQDLQKVGVPIIPTEFIEPTDDIQPDFLQSTWESRGDFVLKPCISAAARDTFLINSAEAASHPKDLNGDMNADFAEWRGDRSFMLQPFLAEIKDLGEWSLMFFGSEYSHGIRKLPKSGEWLVQDELGGSVHWQEPPADVIEVARLTSAALPKDCSGLSRPLLFARIDLIPTSSGPLVGEVELIEPELFFLQRPDHKGYEPALRLFEQALSGQ